MTPRIEKLLCDAERNVAAADLALTDAAESPQPIENQHVLIAYAQARTQLAQTQAHLAIAWQAADDA